MQIRDQLLETVFQDAKNKMNDVSQDSDGYRDIIQRLTLQALYSLMAKDITVCIRPQDHAISQDAISEAVNEFTRASGIKCSHTIKNELSEKCRGGVIVWGFHGRIKVDNTLDQRLHLLEEKMLPELRTMLYGKNPNRKHEN